MHVVWASSTSVFVVAMTVFVRARSLLPLATGWRTVHPWQSATAQCHTLSHTTQRTRHIMMRNPAEKYRPFPQSG